jgi:large subunit ribosomal protein L29
MASVKELRELTRDELVARAAELKQTLFDLRNKHSTGVLDSTADLEKTKREIARILTVAREKELAAGKGKE